MMSLAKSMLDDGDCTLVVVNGKVARRFFQRGVADLLWLLDNESELLMGASLADKMVGKAAAALMIEGKVGEVFTRVVTNDARLMLEQAGIAVEYDEVADYVMNRARTGRCPMDTLCAELSDAHEMAIAIRNFVNENNLSS